MSPLKRIVVGLSALVAVVLTVAMIALKSADLNVYKGKIETWTLQQTGRTLDIRGKVHATVLPRLGLTLNDVVLANAESFDGTDFVTVRSGNVQVKLLPDGKTNWDDMMSNTAVVEADVGEDMMQEVEAGAPVIAALSIGSLTLSDSSVRYADARDDRYVMLRDVNLSTDSIILSEPFAFQADFGVVHEQNHEVIPQVVASGDITVDLAENRYQVEGLSLETDAFTPLPAAGALALKINGDFSADLNKQTLDLVIGDGVVAGVPMMGELHVTDMNDQIQVMGNLHSNEFNLLQVLQVGDIANQQWAPLADQLGKFATTFEQSNDQRIEWRS